MDQMYVQIASLLTNISIIIVGAKIVRHLSRMELKVDLMWNRFQRHFDVRETDKIEGNI